MEISLMEHTDSPAVHFKLAQIKTTNSGADGICNHMNVSGKWQARYQMLTIWVAVVKCSSRTGAVLLDQLDRSDPTQTQTAVFSQKSPLCNTQFYTLIRFCFSNHLRFAAAAYYGYHRCHKVACLCMQIQNIQGFCFSSSFVKPFDLICCCVKWFQY